jgi:hypothetical protein
MNSIILLLSSLSKPLGGEHVSRDHPNDSRPAAICRWLQIGRRPADDHSLNGVVETVDPVARALLLRGAGGAESGVPLSVVVGPQVQRLDQILPGAGGPGCRRVLAAKPALRRRDRRSARDCRMTRGTCNLVRRGRVVITAVDPPSGTISFVGPNQVVRTVSPKNPNVLRLTRSLKAGDQVDVVYEEALAISVEPMK